MTSSMVTGVLHEDKFLLVGIRQTNDWNDRAYIAHRGMCGQAAIVFGGI